MPEVMSRSSDVEMRGVLRRDVDREETGPRPFFSESHSKLQNLKESDIPRTRAAFFNPKETGQESSIRLPLLLPKMEEQYRYGLGLQILAELVEDFIREVANDIDLKRESFISLSRMSIAASDRAESSDGI
ncbi:hypothetical protein L2E82_44994 [Cichorium intybus]|uniref:Uncharacterized protein n=1 Tax=Cichorium intybus TaxID=13427 RepID=A0ACB8ZT42_CICIN|nr:hypothetical protein L2E82_44994 [Cichorium intybus]